MNRGRLSTSGDFGAPWAIYSDEQRTLRVGALWPTARRRSPQPAGRRGNPPRNRPSDRMRRVPPEAHRNIESVQRVGRGTSGQTSPDDSDYPQKEISAKASPQCKRRLRSEPPYAPPRYQGAAKTSRLKKNTLPIRL